MPIGASKVGALGGLVPGGSVTFNTSDTWVVPPGVKVVNITGTGGTGNPGNAGNQGNPGNPGSGGSGGAGGNGFLSSYNSDGPTSNQRGYGGSAWKSCRCGNLWLPNAAPAGNNNQWTTKAGACAGQSGVAGATGNAGTAGNPGNPGNSGQQSSGLTKTFCGGSGGNAGVGGAAGNGGTGGGGGGAGGSASNSAAGNPGPGGNAGGNGGSGASSPGASAPPQFPNPGWTARGGKGGGGAGAINSGSSGQTFPYPIPCWNPVTAGGTGNAVACITSLPSGFSGKISTNTQGGSGGGACSSGMGGASVKAPIATGINVNFCLLGPNNPLQSVRNTFPQFSPVPCAPQIFRSGGGGGKGANTENFVNNSVARSGGGGGGGGRGNAGNAGGPTPTPSGSAATPATFNCVPVTPGGSYPIVVGAPGGSVVISWNPQ